MYVKILTKMNCQTAKSCYDKCFLYLSGDNGGHCIHCDGGNVSRFGLLHWSCHFLFLHVHFIFLCKQNICSVCDIVSVIRNSYLNPVSFSFVSCSYCLGAVCGHTFLQKTDGRWDFAKLILGKDRIFSCIVCKGHRDLQSTLSGLFLVGNFIPDEHREWAI